MNFTETLLIWYSHNKRQLPWRDTTDAYIIWLSEIILQQTRVEQGLPYFFRFAERFPTVTHFAAASEDEILNLWQGLGYYSRGRNMLVTARLIQDKHQGIFPNKYDQLISLKGIGRYTASAISSFSSNEAKAVVDGNVSRVIARYFGICEPINSTKGKKLFQQIADDLLNPTFPGLHNQAMMEFGALQCKPKNPICSACPFQTECKAYQNRQISLLPIKLKTVKIKKRYFNYLVIVNDGEIILKKRDTSDIWANMYDMPLIETDNLVEDDKITDLIKNLHYIINDMPIIMNIEPVKKHILTHQHIYYRFIHINIENIEIKLEPKLSIIKVENLKNIALPKIIFIFLDKFLNSTHHPPN